MWSIALLDLAIVLPLIGAGLIVLAGHHPNLREAMTLLTALALLAVVFLVVDLVIAGERPEVALIGFLPGVSIALSAEPLGCLFALVASLLWLVTSCYSIGYMRGHKERNQTRFYAFFAVAIACAMGVAFADNLVTLFVFYEALTLSTFPLVGHAGTAEARRGARTYAGLLLAASFALMLPAIVATHQAAGTVDFVPGGILAGKISETGAAVVLALFVFGIAKAAVMPLHRWLPAAMVAPTPVSALLHAVAVVKAGVFAIVKVVVYVIGIDVLGAAGTQSAFVAIAGLTIVIAGMVALNQDNLKRRLAYSTVSQLSYVVMAAVLLTPLSLAGAALHIAAHAFGKITLFFCAGAILVASHKTEISELAGIGRRMPWTMGAFAVATLSMIGLPPTAGFVSKWFILSGAWQAEQYLAVGVLVASTLLSAAYLVPILYRAFFLQPAALPTHGAGADLTPANAVHGEAPLSMVAALLVTAAGTVLLFFFPGVFLDLASRLAGLDR